MLASEFGNFGHIAYAPFRITVPEARVERRITWRRMPAVLLERAIQVKHAAVRQQASAASHQPFRRAPWRNVDHVDGHDGIRTRHWPHQRRGIKFKRSHKVRQLCGTAIGRDTPEGTRIEISGLPHELRKSGGEMNRMLAGAAGDLQYGAARRQNPPQHSKNRIAVAGDRW